MTFNFINSLTPFPKLDVEFIISLDEYTNETRETMEEKGIFLEFLKTRPRLMSRVLQKYPDTLLIGSDLLLTNSVTIPTGGVLCLSPSYINNPDVAKKYGKFNADLIWTSNRDFPVKWIDSFETSTFYDQKPLDFLVTFFNTTFFHSGHNIQSWRWIHNGESEIKKFKNFEYDSNPIVSFHNHFAKKDPVMKNFRDFVFTISPISVKILISYLEHNCRFVFQLSTAKPDLNFSQLAKINSDYEMTSNTYHSFADSVQIKDQVDPEPQTLSRYLHGNSRNSNWIFWARNPKLLEDTPVIPFAERTLRSIFIGNIENKVQGDQRDPDVWKTKISKFVLTRGIEKYAHAFTPTEYYSELSKAKFGLCLGGYGHKCHREVEYAALGVIPVFARSCVVAREAYLHPMIENRHYLVVNDDGSDFEDKISSLKNPEIMSENVRHWYLNLCHSSKLTETILRTMSLWYPTICVVMMIRDEEENIKTSIPSLSMLNPDFVFISDTGSLDNTISVSKNLIESKLKMTPNRYQIESHKWTDDFSKNRNLAIESASKRFNPDFIYIIDADDYVEEAPVDLHHKLAMLSPDISVINVQTIFGNVKNFRPQIIRPGKAEYKGILHEYLTFQPYTEIFKDFKVVCRTEGFRSRNPTKYIDDASVLLKSLPKNMTNFRNCDPRTVFYIAKSFHDAQLYAIANLIFQERISMHPMGFSEEAYIAGMLILSNLLKDESFTDFSRVESLALRTFEINKARLEVPYLFMNFGVKFSKNSDIPRKSFSLAIRALGENPNMHISPDFMFCEELVYGKPFLDEIEKIKMII